MEEGRPITVGPWHVSGTLKEPNTVVYFFTSYFLLKMKRDPSSRQLCGFIFACGDGQHLGHQSLLITAHQRQNLCKLNRYVGTPSVYDNTIRFEISYWVQQRVAFNPRHQERGSTPSSKPIDISAPSKVGIRPPSRRVIHWIWKRINVVVWLIVVKI